MNRRVRLLLTLLAATGASALAGCASSTPKAPASAAAAATTPATAPAAPRLGAKPWDRGELAKRCMRFDGYPLELALDEHIYFSKEASSGGSGFAGGGCGCN
ncbi:MAG: DUF4266 domain-containing protein [Thermoanaerobaculia bacterium]|jgi:hypothetical protein|nr:DUF4266 domain-containing protein [Thermoanaerobaculia bacterium]